MSEVLIEFDIPAEPLNMNNSDGRAAKRDYIKRKQIQ